jgi:mannose-6-phosphate isomerase-like protein (cupin superfamily)
MLAAMRYEAGNAREDAAGADRRGWFIGAFMDGAQKSSDLEVKFWSYAAGESVDHPMKTSTATEFTYIISGAVEAVVAGDTFILLAGDYVLIRPGTPNNTVSRVLEDCQGLTVKSPSDPANKTVI